MKKLLYLTLLFAFFSASFTSTAQFFEDFESGDKTYYGAATISLSTGNWYLNDALIGTLANDKKNGTRSVRIQNSGTMEMSFDYPNGMIDVSFFAANYGSDGVGNVRASYSIDGGTNWTFIGDPIPLTATLTKYTLSKSIEGNVRLRFTKSGGTRINIDDVRITDFIQVIEEPTLVATINNLPYSNGEVFNFGKNTGTITASLLVRNIGLQDLNITSFTLSNPEFSITGSLTGTLASMASKTVTISYQSETLGLKSGNLKIFSNDPENSEYTINLLTEHLDPTLPIPIADARKLPLGSPLTVAGWVTAASQFRGPLFLQDETGGIGWFHNDIMRVDWLVDAVIGDSIVVSGVLGQFNNLLQVTNHTNYETFAESHRDIEPAEITFAQLNSGAFEGMLVRVTDMNFSSTGTFSGATNYNGSDASGQGQIRIDGYTDIPGMVIPNNLSAITGISGRYINTHQLMPRFRRDIEVLVGPIIISAPPYEVSATSNSITLAWETKHAGHSEIRYGVTSTFELGRVKDETPKTNHLLTIPNLDPATIYKVQLRSAIAPDTSATDLYVTITSSPVGTSGQILAYFNKSVAHQLATFREADQNVNFSQKLIERIESAELTAEFAFYSLSGTVGTNVVNAIIAAKNRGVDVRVIVTGHSGINPFVETLQNAGVKATHSLGAEQMHNKFAVIDANHTDPSKTWLVTSSWNATDDGTNNQYQNMLQIQDVSLARAYLSEFNQMWGGSSGAFNASLAKFSEKKKVVNPSVIWIGEDATKVELHFSPQSNTESHIIRALSSANTSIELTQNLITRRTLSNAMLNRFNEGVKVRGTMGVVTGVTEFDFLKTWADIHHFSQSANGGLLHHKHAIVDGEKTTSNSKVITGSHNWSANANFKNDENTLILQNQRVANEYFQEFAARYWQAGGQEEFDVTVSVGEISDDSPSKIGMIKNFPNPFSSNTSIQFDLQSEQTVSLTVFDISGRAVSTLLRNEKFERGQHTVDFDGSKLAGGIYIYKIQISNGDSAAGRMSLIR
jgi:phosphatidylserine/phosphatidylglycerophosphate/cardiolipin synthase-like enzyme